MIHLDLFSGIGGFALAAERVWPNIEHTFCEIDPFCQAVLRKHWPEAIIYNDIRSLTNAGSQKQRRVSSGQRKAVPAIGRVDLLTGGFPCQPFSHAGSRKGTQDDRYLWPEMRRVIQEFSPHYVVAENVRGLLSIDGGVVFESVCSDLEALGYEVQPFVIPACAVGAPHRRDRVWIVGHAKHDGQPHAEGREGNGERTGKSSRAQEVEQPTRPALSRDLDATDAPGVRSSERKGQSAPSRSRKTHAQPGLPDWAEDWPTVAARLCTLDDGLPAGLVRPHGWRNAALKAAGNAIVPQVAEQIFRAILSTSSKQNT